MEIILDSQLLLKEHVEVVTKMALDTRGPLHVHVVLVVPFPQQGALQIVAYALVLYMRLCLKSTQKTHLFQDAKMRAVVGNPHYTHVTPVLLDLCWLHGSRLPSAIQIAGYHLIKHFFSIRSIKVK